MGNVLLFLSGVRMLKKNLGNVNYFGNKDQINPRTSYGNCYKN